MVLVISFVDGVTLHVLLWVGIVTLCATINTEHPAKILLLRLGCVHRVTHVFIRIAAKPRDLEGLCALWPIEKHKNVGLKSIL